MAKVFKRKWKNQRGEQTTWAFSYNDTFGKRKIESGFNTKVEAEKALSKKLQEIENGIYVEENKNITFEQMAEKHMRLYVSQYLKKTTFNCYSDSLKHLLPIIGKMKLGIITPNTMFEYISLKKRETKLSNTTINKHLTLTKSILSHAVKQRLLTHNPLDDFKKLPENKTEQICLTEKEVFAVLDVAKKYYPDFYPLLLTAIFTGARQGELLSLTWDHINFVEGYIKIDKRVYDGEVSTPKTEHSNRKINLPNEVIRVLKEWRLACPHSDLNLVFPNQKGNYQNKNNLVKRKFKPVLRRAGVTEIRFHDLRHTFASILLTNDAHIKYVQNQMGHSSIKVTMDTYSHLLPEAHKKGVDTLNKVLELPKQEEKDHKFGT